MIELGVGAQAVLARGGHGEVAATFAKAAYLRVPAGLVAVTTPAVFPGPIHARGPFPVARLRRGMPVRVDGPRLDIGPLSFDLAGASVWEGRLPDAGDLVARSALALRVLDHAPPPAVTFDGDDLGAAVDALSGLGPGLTPVGDDVLAGMLLIARIRRPDDDSLVELAGRARTNDVARAFLLWAARGQSIEPVHRFLAAVAAEDEQAARSALADLLRVGHTSGADLAAGLRLGLRAVVANVA